MDFVKRIKTRQRTAYCDIIVGLLLTVAANLCDVEIMFSLGAAFLVVGIVNTVRYRRLMKNPEELRKREIIEKDERNIMLWTKARSLAFVIYVITSGIAVIVLHLVGMSDAAHIVSWCMTTFVVIYWICYLIISRKN